MVDGNSNSNVNKECILRDNLMYISLILDSYKENIVH